MLRLGHMLSRVCGGVTRRELLQAGAISAIGLSLPAFLRMRAAAAPTTVPRSMILLWLWGGPSHLDTFDMKPGAPSEYRGPFEPIATTVPGMRVCELLPSLARR